MEWNSRVMCNKTLYSGIELICVFIRTMFSHYQTTVSIRFFLFLIPYLLFELHSTRQKCDVWTGPKKVWRPQLANLHDAARAISRPSRCFLFVNKKSRQSSFFRELLCWDDATYDFCQHVKRLMRTCLSFWHSEVSNCENEIDKEFWEFELKQQNRNCFSGWLNKELP